MLGSVCLENMCTCQAEGRKLCVESNGATLESDSLLHTCIWQTDVGNGKKQLQCHALKKWTLMAAAHTTLKPIL